MDERIGQLFMLGFTGTSVSPELAELLKEYRPGGLILFARNLEGVEQIVNLTNDLQRLSPGSPLLISIDQEGGRVSRLPSGFTIFPPCATVGSCDSTELARQAAAVTASELRAVGINMNMAPVLDVNSNPDNPIIGDRSFSADPAKVSKLGLATITGLQEHRVAACGKHFPGHGDTVADSHKELPVVSASRERLEQVELLPFRQVLARGHEGLAAIMTAHVLYPSLDAQAPATLSPAILTGLLREQMKFEGLILTDDLEMHAIIDHYGVGEAAVLAVEAGADVLLICKDRDRQVAAFQGIRDAAREGRIAPARLDASLRRVARIKDRFLHPYAPADLAAAREIVGSRTHQTVLDAIVQRAKAPA
ncbi:MAG TPA: beta-N-acetylhexosaminidase [Nitrospiraceae bacterium]|nr:beta-N-acetylhexosaminidase [Nitrospiraceae bacterium]